MCNAHNHPPDCTCGWGGKDHKGKRTGTNSALIVTRQVKIKRKGVSFSDAFSVGARIQGLQKTAYVNSNAKCPVCGKRVFFYQSADGGRVFFDALGKPWPKHPCTDSRESTSVQIPHDFNKWKKCSCKRFYIPPNVIVCPTCCIERSNPRVEDLKKEIKYCLNRMVLALNRSKIETDKYYRGVFIHKYNLEVRRINEKYLVLSKIDPVYEGKAFKEYPK